MKNVEPALRDDEVWAAASQPCTVCGDDPYRLLVHIVPVAESEFRLPFALCIACDEGVGDQALFDALTRQRDRAAGLISLGW